MEVEIRLYIYLALLESSHTGFVTCLPYINHNLGYMLSAKDKPCISNHLIHYNSTSLFKVSIAVIHFIHLNT